MCTVLLPPRGNPIAVNKYVISYINLIGSQLVKKFRAFYGTRRFITADPRASHLSLCSARSIQSIPPHSTPWRSMAWGVLKFWRSGHPPIWRVAANILNKQYRTGEKRWSSSLGGFGEVPTTHHRKKITLLKISTHLLITLITFCVKIRVWILQN